MGWRTGATWGGLGAAALAGSAFIPGLNLVSIPAGLAAYGSGAAAITGAGAVGGLAGAWAGHSRANFNAANTSHLTGLDHVGSFFLPYSTDHWNHRNQILEDTANFKADKLELKRGLKLGRLNSKFDFLLKGEELKSEFAFTKRQAHYNAKLQNYHEYIKGGGAWGMTKRGLKKVWDVPGKVVSTGHHHLIEAPRMKFVGTAKKLGVAALVVGGGYKLLQMFSGPAQTPATAMLDAEKEFNEELAAGQQQTYAASQVGEPTLMGMTPTPGKMAASVRGNLPENKAVPPAFTGANFQPVEDALQSGQTGGLSPA